MKKFSVFAVVAVLVASALTSCNGIFSTQPQTAEDSLSVMFGEMYGHGVARELASGPDSATFNKASFLKGLELVLNADTSDISYIQGMQFGAQLTQMFRQTRTKEQVTFNNQLILQEFSKAFMADSNIDPQFIQMKFMELMKRVSREKKEQAPQAIANRKAGEAFMNDLKKNDPDVLFTESGLAYKVIAEGEGENFKKNQRIMIKYTGTRIDGEVFDQKEEAIAMSPMSFVQGFREGITMMKPGAKFMLYIPCDLAYGVEGKGSIGPNETLIFEVETEGLAPERTASKDKKKK